ncbi:MAG: hypothetical protein QM705_15815 [Ancrocorticia sp.]
MATPRMANVSFQRVLAVGMLPALMLWVIFQLWPGPLISFALLAIPLTALVATIPLQESKVPVDESLLAALLSALAVGAFSLIRGWSDSGTYMLIFAGVPLLAMAPALILAFKGRIPRVTTAIATATLLVWALIHGLGFGLNYLLPATILGIATIVAFRTPSNGHIPTAISGVNTSSSTI